MLEQRWQCNCDAFIQFSTLSESHLSLDELSIWFAMALRFVHTYRYIDWCRIAFDKLILGSLYAYYVTLRCVYIPRHTLTIFEWKHRCSNSYISCKYYFVFNFNSFFWSSVLFLWIKPILGAIRYLKSKGKRSKHDIKILLYIVGWNCTRIRFVSGFQSFFSGCSSFLVVFPLPVLACCFGISVHRNGVYPAVYGIVQLFVFFSVILTH